MFTYRTCIYVSPLVQRVLEIATQQAFERSCLPEVGRLLSVLVSHIQHGLVGEVGTGIGVRAAWMLSRMAPTTRFVTVETNAQRAIAAQNLFRDLPNAQVIYGDWHEILSYGPFDLLFLDAGEFKMPRVSDDYPADIVLYQPERNRLYFIYAINRFGPLFEHRKSEMETLLKRCSAECVYVTVFYNRSDYFKYSISIAWHSQVWLAERPDHIILLL